MKKFSEGKLVIRAASAKELKDYYDIESPIKNKKIFLALYEGEVVGACQCSRIEPRKKEGIISGIEVKRGFKRKGIGHKLLGKAHAYFKRNGIEKSSVAPNKKNKKFYKKAGYETPYKNSHRLFRTNKNIRRPRR